MPGPVLGTRGSAMHKADKFPSTCRIYIFKEQQQQKKYIKCKQVKLNKKNNFRFSDEKEQGRVLEYRVPGGFFRWEDQGKPVGAGPRAELSPE